MDEYIIIDDNEGEIYTYELKNDLIFNGYNEMIDLKNCEYQIRKKLNYNNNFILSVIRLNNKIKYISIFTIRGEFLTRIIDLKYCENTNFYYEYINKNFIECDNTCETCDGKLKINCLTCVNSFPTFSTIHSCKNNEKECNKDYYLWYIDLNNNLYCVNNITCPINFKYFIKETKECVSSCDNLDDFYKSKGFNCMKCKENQIQIFTDCYEKNEIDKITNKISDNILFINGCYNYFDLLNTKLEIYEYPLQNNKDLNLYECEDKIMEKNEKVIIIKKEVYENNLIYNPLEFRIFDLNGKEINLDLCDSKDIIILHENIDLNLIDENLKKLNLNLSSLNDDFYNNICFKYEYKNKDISLKDRILIFNSENSLCNEEICRFDSIYLNNKSITCKCNKNYQINDFNGNFFDDNINYRILKCYKYLQNFDSYNNIGFYFSLLLFVGELFCLLLYIILGKNIIIKKLYRNVIFPNPIGKYNEINNQNNNEITNKKKEISNNELFEENKLSNRTKYSQYKMNLNLGIPNSSLISFNKSNELSKILKEKKKNKINYLDMKFTDAIEKDKREFNSVFIDILCHKLFLSKNVFIFNISNIVFYLILDLFFNSLFYSQNIMSKILHNKLNFWRKLLISIISSIFSYIIWKSVNMFINSKNNNIIDNLEKEYFTDSPFVNNIDYFYKRIKIWIFFYFFFQILISSFCFIYLIIFFGIYINSKKIIFINLLISMLFIFLMIMMLSLLKTKIRILSIKKRNSKLFLISNYI